MTDALSSADIAVILGCAKKTALQKMLMYMPYYNITPLGMRATYRVDRKDFDKWLAAQRRAPEMDRILKFREVNLK